VVYNIGDRHPCSNHTKARVEGGQLAQKRLDSRFAQPPFLGERYRLWREAEFDWAEEADRLANGLVSLLKKANDERPSQFASLSNAIYRMLYALAREYGLTHHPVSGLPDMDDVLREMDFVDPEFLGMHLLVHNLWRHGKPSLNSDDIIGLRRERGFRQPRGERELLDLRYRLRPVDRNTPVSPTVLPKVEPAKRKK
jgi:hypothetical protein